MFRELERSEAYMAKIFVDALDKDITLSALLSCVYDYEKHKLRVWYKAKSCWCKFPNALRVEGREFRADVIKRSSGRGNIFYQAYKNSIQDAITGELLG